MTARNDTTKLALWQATPISLRTESLEVILNHGCGSPSQMVLPVSYHDVLLRIRQLEDREARGGNAIDRPEPLLNILAEVDLKRAIKMR
jgi:hypothetical protein